MSPAIIAAIMSAVEALIQEEPAIATDLKALFSGSVPTAADWAALRANIAAESYGSFVPGSSLPPSETGPTS